MDGYTLREAAQQVGCSVPWLRKSVKAGYVEAVQERGRYGPTYYISADAIDTARTLYTMGSTEGAPVARDTLLALREQTRSLAEQVAALSGERGKREAAEVEVARLRDREQELQHRVEVLLSLSAWDRLMGRHKGV